MKKLALLLFAVSLISCEGVVEPNSLTTHIEGTVTDLEDGSALRNVTVYIFKKKTEYDGQYFYERVGKKLKQILSDEQGFYSLSFEIQEGTPYYVGAERFDYRKTDVRFAPSVKYESSQRIDIQLRKKS